MKAGFGKAAITPEKLYPMAGYDLRKEKALGAHDALEVRALYLDGMVILALDLLGVSAELCQRLEKAVEGALPEEALKGVVSFGIHTHAAPKAVFSSFDCYDPAYIEKILEAAAKASCEAFEAAKEGTATFFSSTVEEVGCCRDQVREKSRFSMPVSSLLFTFHEGEAPILWTAVACHPTVLNESNLYYSRDLFWGTSAYLEGALHTSQIVLMNGACGDISTRYTRREASFEEAERLGAVLGKGIEESLSGPGLRMAGGKAGCQADGEAGCQAGVRFLTRELRIPEARYFSEEEKKRVFCHLEERLASCTDPAQKRDYQACRSVLLRPSYGKKRGDQTVRLSVLSLPGLSYLLMPFEFASADGSALAKAVEARFGGRAVIGCYADGYEGYLPSGRPLDAQSHYEDMASHFVYNAKELVKEAFINMLEAQEEKP